MPAPRILTTKTKRTRIRIRPTTISGKLQQQRGNVPRFLKYASGNSNDYNDISNVDVNIRVNPTNGDIRFKQSNNTNTSEKVKVNEKGVVYSRVLPSKSSNTIISSTSSNIDISELSKRVIAADFLRQQQEKEKEQRLTLLNRTKNRTKTPSITIVRKSKDKRQIKNKNTTTTSNSKKRSSLLKRRWRRLRPSQKFRLRLGITAFVIASFWNIIVVRGMSGIGSSIGFMPITTATAPNKYGILKLLRKWISSRGFQGLAAAGRTVAYFWAILVGYPRMLDKRSKSSRRKREEETLDKWRALSRTSSEEIVRLRSELSLVEKEIRVFRREILAIRAARMNNNNNDNNTNTNGGIIVERNNDESKLIREVILQEMYQLTQLRDDTRALLTSSRKRWAEIYAKRSYLSSNSSTSSQQQHVDLQQQLEFELDAAATLGYVVGDNNDKHLLPRNNQDRRYGDGNTSSTNNNNNNNDVLLSGF